MTQVKPEAEAEAFKQWATEFNKDYKKVAEAYDISIQTAYSWGRKYEWNKRRQDILDTLTEPAFNEAMSEIRLSASTVAQRLMSIVKGPSSDYDALNAIKLWISLNVTDRSDSHAGPLTLVDARQIHITDTEAMHLTPGQRTSTVTAILSDNINDAEIDKKRRRNDRTPPISLS